MYPEKFTELTDIVRELAPGADDAALERASGELLVGLGQSGSASDAASLAARVFRETFGINMTPAEADSAGEKIFVWRSGWKDVLY